MRVAFYPTLKTPDHCVPSGDREMARLLLAALHHAGHETQIVSRLRSFSRQPETEGLARLEAAARAETQRLLAWWAGPGARQRPDLWLTYHLYYKAPDLIGPAIAAALAIPYVIAEASHAQKRNHDLWQPWQAYVERALLVADCIVCFTDVDRAGLAHLPGLKARLVDLPPFIDAAAFGGPPVRPAGASLRLVTVAMMRAGVKLQSYQFLAQALHTLGDLDWQLKLIGDGPAHADVAAAFAGFEPGRILFEGEVPHATVRAHLAGADLFLWPGFGEAYGLVYLEAQAMGVPVVALACGGIASTMQAGLTGLLVSEQTPMAYGQAVRSLMLDTGARRTMAASAFRFVQRERNLEVAAGILSFAIHQAKDGGGR